MAEVFGIVAGVAGFASVLVQVIRGVDTLREISRCANKAPAELASLTADLECLKHLMEEIIAKAPCNGNSMLQMCHTSCEDVVRCLEKLNKRVLKESEGTRKQNLRKIFAFRHWIEDVEVLQRSILVAKINLILFMTYRSSVQQEEIKLLNQNYTLSPQMLSLNRNLDTIPTPSPTPDSSSSDKSNSDSHAIAGIQPSQRRRRWDCTKIHCSCSCHVTVRTNRRFWALEYTPLNVFRQTCDDISCNGTKYGGTLSIALSQLGIRWSAIIQFHILAAPGKFLFRPTFEVERIVPYTSPGFEVLWSCRRGEIMFEEAQDKLVSMYRSDPTFKNHINPGGKSYIEELVKVPWGPESRLKQYKLLKLFMGEFGMTKGTQNARFLASCAWWIGEGPHLELLEILLELGFDTTVIDSPNAQDWPEPSSPNWYAEDIAPDPFYVEYQGMLLRDNQGFAGLAPLHEALLLGTLDLVKKQILRSKKNERSFLGQTPIHFAVSNLEYLRALIDAGHNLDAIDNYGITPLMYAAAANHEECLVALLGAGANPNIRDTRYQRNFIDYAAIREHWNLIFRSLCWIKEVEKTEIAESWAHYATVLYYASFPDYWEKREVSSKQLLAKCGSVNFTFDDSTKTSQNNSLMHYVRSVKDIEVLLEHGFILVNHRNSIGQHALISVILKQCQPDVVRRLVSAGAEINLEDNLHHTALYYVLNELHSSHEYILWTAMEHLRILLVNGADVLHRDCCRCPCSPDGCLPSAVLTYPVHLNYFNTYDGLSRSLEWLSLILEHRGTVEARTILLSFIRKAKFDEMGMTHVCCSHDIISYSSLLFQKSSKSDEDIDEILDEEFEFIEILENEMVLSSAKVYETLLDDWILHINTAPKKSC